MDFFPSLIRDLVEAGHHVDIACNDNLAPVSQIFTNLGCRISTIGCTRSPFHPGSLKAIRQLKSLVQREQYDIVHCHTPVAAFCTRLACRKLPCKVVYTAHGFHFYKGAPLKNWLLFYPAEKLCAHFTDVLITINREDYALARNKMKAKKIVYVPGVGIDLEQFQPGSHSLTRESLEIPAKNRVILSVGELSARKNHQVLIRAAAQLQNVTLLIAGIGSQESQLKELARSLDVDVRFLGYRKDIAALCGICDLFVLPSFQEGLPVALMEAMACGKAVSCSAIRGNTDLVDADGGTLFDPGSAESCHQALHDALSGDLAGMGRHNRQTVNAFSIEAVNQQMLEIYQSL